MKRFLIVAALLIVGLCNYAIAQSEAEALVTASVENELILVNVDGDWGVMSPGVTYIITPSGFKEPPGPGEGAGIVVDAIGFEVDGNAGSEVLVSLVLPAGLLSDDENGSLPTSNWTYGWNYDNDPSVAFSAAGPVTGGGVTLTIGGGAASGLFLGATVSVPTTAFAGGYTGQIIGSATYTGN
ncbi:MAG TPA: hypothetical protein VGR15_04515 [Bacteroidota bacterium]|nr:hypothetical protein [Bacteroidota bacterium]